MLRAFSLGKDECVCADVSITRTRLIERENARDLTQRQHLDTEAHGEMDEVQRHKNNLINAIKNTLKHYYAAKPNLLP